MSWLIYAVIANVTLCGAIEATRRAKLDGYEVLLYRCLITGFLLLPFSPYMTWPKEFGFYVMLAITALVYGYGNIVMSNLATRKSGRVAMMYQPLMIFFTFLLWLLIDKTERLSLQSHPSDLWATAACFGVLVISLHFIRRNDYAWKALLTVFPIALGFAMLNVGQKWFLSTPDGGMGMILAIIMVSNFGMVTALPLLGRFRVKTEELKITHLPRFPLEAIAAVAIFHAVSWACLMHAMQISDNPAYPVALMALTPVMFQLYYWVRGWRDNASPVAGAAMTLSAFALGILHT